MFGMNWKDSDWPSAVNFKEGTILEEDKLLEIKEFMEK
jgi:hypothetical protein